jgi:hypothetical protein
MQKCQGCIAANPTYSMFHVFSQAKFKRRHKQYIHNDEVLARRIYDAPFYVHNCEGTI